MAARVNQLGNTANRSLPVEASPVYPTDVPAAPAVVVAEGTPTRVVNGAALQMLGQNFKGLFDRYASDRIPAEQTWLKSLRQYLGIYDPEVERQLPPNRSRAYPRLTRVKCVSMLSRLMNLMFPGNEDNWELNASPSPEISPHAVADAVQKMMTEMQAQGQPVELTQELVDAAVRRLATESARKLTTLIKDQLMELGGSQTYDWIALNRKVVDSGVRYGIGVLEGPYVRKIQTSGWVLQAQAGIGPDGQPTPGGFKPVDRIVYKPQYDHLSVWDFYPDMSARSLPGEGYFVRKVLGRSALRKLAERPDFFATQIKAVIAQTPGGNYRAKAWETELRTMGVSVHADGQGSETTGRDKFEIIVWKGPVSGHKLREVGVDVSEEHLTDDLDAELWMIDTWVIKAEINAWRKLGVDVPQVHVFSFDEDDTSPIGQGLPSIVRDSQLSICAATRMTLDNASVTCGPNLEVNTRLLRADQELTSVEAYKIWYRDDDGLTAQFPAIRSIEINGHLPELQSLIKMFMEYAEVETFIGPATGGDMQRMPSEPMRTAAGASMLRGDAALPFKDIVRNYDTFTQSVIWSLVQFNKKYNPEEAPEGDYDVIPRGATSLIAKEVRGAQIDMLSQTLTPDERDHIDERKFIEAKFASRDLTGMLVSEDQAAQNKSGRAQVAAEQAKQQSRMAEAQIRETMATAYSKVGQGQKNMANADHVNVKAATEMITSGEPNGTEEAASASGKPNPGSGQTA